MEGIKLTANVNTCRREHVGWKKKRTSL